MRGCLADWPDDKLHIQLPWIQIPAGDHQLCCLALLPILPELPRCRRSSGRTGDHRQLRGDPIVVSEIRPCLHSYPQAATRSPGRHVAPGRTLPHHPGAAAVSLACGRSRRRRDRHSAPASPRSTCGVTVLPHAAQESGLCASADGYRQAEELCSSPSNDHALSSPRHEPIRKQSGGSLPRTDPTTGARHAKSLIHRSSATVLVGAWNHPESLPCRTSPVAGSQLPNVAGSCIRCLERGDVCLTRIMHEGRELTMVIPDRRRLTPLDVLSEDRARLKTTMIH